MFLSDRYRITTKREYSDEGFLKVPARISRTGIQEYLASEMGLNDREPTDIIRVWRPEEEVFSDVSMKSFENKPVTNNHPPELVNASNYKDYSVGFSSADVTRDGMFVSTLLHISDAEAIKLVESGKVELSNGYISDIEWEQGITPDGENYDAIQRNIRGNHIAIVERGRAGSSCRVADNLTIDKEKRNMPKITIDGVDYEVTDQAAQAVGKLQRALSDAEMSAEEKEKEDKKKQDEFEKKEKEGKKSEDSLQAKLDDALSKVPDATVLDSMVSSRVALIDSATKVLPDLKWEGKDQAAIHKEVVGAKCPNVNLDSVSEDYIAARFDMLVESVGGNSQHSLDTAFSQQVSTDTETEDTRPAHIIARDKMAADSRNAWKGEAK